MAMNRFLLLFGLLALVAAASHAESPAQVYWHSVLPNTPMPAAIEHHLSPPVLVDEKADTNVDVGHGKTYVSVGTHVIVNTDIHHKPSFLYKYAATETQLHDDPTIALFFLESDLHPGKRMELHFTKTAVVSPFLPRRTADSIPFVSAKLPEILARFSVEPGSHEAEAMATTLRECEEPAAEGESKSCATSLESMVEFSTSQLGTNDVQALSTATSKEGSPAQTYTVVLGLRLMAGSGRLVACHVEAYAYAVFYCHTAQVARAYTVPMVGRDGTVVKAVAVCHSDTAKWNPDHIAFKVLHVKPGTVPVCHFVPEDHVIWIPNK